LAVSATDFEILTLKARKSLNFLDRPLFEAPVRGNPLEFGDGIWRQKTRGLGLPDGEEIMPLAFFVMTQYRRVIDGQTDFLDQTPSKSMKQERGELNLRIRKTFATKKYVIGEKVL